MKVNVQAVNFNVDRKIGRFCQERMDKLEKYYDKIVSSEVFMKVEKQVIKKIKTVKLKLMFLEMIFGKKQCKTFEEGVDLSVDSLEIIVKRKEKIRAHS